MSISCGSTTLIPQTMDGFLCSSRQKFQGRPVDGMCLALAFLNILRMFSIKDKISQQRMILRNQRKLHATLYISHTCTWMVPTLKLKMSQPGRPSHVASRDSVKSALFTRPSPQRNSLNVLTLGRFSSSCVFTPSLWHTAN